jgi:hypothetical protein
MPTAQVVNRITPFNYIVRIIAAPMENHDAVWPRRLTIPRRVIWLRTCSLLWSMEHGAHWISA